MALTWEIFGIIAGLITASGFFPQIIKGYRTKRLKVNVDECVYIDDNEEYSNVAKKLGMHNIHYTSYGSLLDSLKKLKV